MVVGWFSDYASLSYKVTRQKLLRYNPSLDNSACGIVLLPRLDLWPHAPSLFQQHRSLPPTAFTAPTITLDPPQAFQ